MSITEERDLYATLVGERDEALGSLSRAQGAHLETKAMLATYRRATWILGSVVLVLVLALVWAVMA
jgi:hypothetical protein